MKAYNLSDLEQQLLNADWKSEAEPFTVDHGVPGLVHDCRYKITLTSPEGSVYRAEGHTRAEAFRASVQTAGVLDEDCPHLV